MCRLTVNMICVQAGSLFGLKDSDYFTPSFDRINSRTWRDCSLDIFWFGIRTRHCSNSFCASGSFSSIISTFVIIFMIQCGSLLCVTPFQPGPTTLSSVSLWQPWHFSSYIPLPFATHSWFKGVVNNVSRFYFSAMHFRLGLFIG